MVALLVNELAASSAAEMAACWVEKSVAETVFVLVKAKEQLGKQFQNKWRNINYNYYTYSIRTACCISNKAIEIVPVGPGVGVHVGLTVGVHVGLTVGVHVGLTVGVTVGVADGTPEQQRQQFFILFLFSIFRY